MMVLKTEWRLFLECFQSASSNTGIFCFLLLHLNMKSLFLKKLSKLLIQDKETDYFDLYNLQSIKNWPIFSISYSTSDDGSSNFESKRMEPGEEIDKTDGEILGLDCCEIINFNEERLILDAGGEWQGINRLTISLDSLCELHVESCLPIPELKTIEVQEITMPTEEEYEKILEEFQTLLENQD